MPSPFLECQADTRYCGKRASNTLSDVLLLPLSGSELNEKGQYHNPKEEKLATTVVEVSCDRNLHIWFAGMAGNNIYLCAH